MTNEILENGLPANLTSTDAKGYVQSSKINAHRVLEESENIRNGTSGIPKRQQEYIIKEESERKFQETTREIEEPEVNESKNTHSFTENDKRASETNHYTNGQVYETDQEFEEDEDISDDLQRVSLSQTDENLAYERLADNGTIDRKIVEKKRNRAFSSYSLALTEMNDVPLDDSEAGSTASSPPSHRRSRSLLMRTQIPIRQTNKRHSIASNSSKYDLLLSRLDVQNQELQQDPKMRRLSLQGTEILRSNFERIFSEALDKSKDENDGIDWDFWGLVVSDYQGVAKEQPKRLSEAIQKGIPSTIRGMMWQLMSRSKDEELEIIYQHCLKMNSVHEKFIQRDLARTFPTHEYFLDKNGTGQENLFNVVKAYSLYDDEVGYTQGLAFITGPLLLNMPDEEAFCVLVRLMKDYNLRGHFIPGMPGLQLRMYQFDRLVEEMLPRLRTHFSRQGIKSSMYASQWFMTLFAYKFPLDFVYRILDIVFAEGVESIFKFSIALLKKNEEIMLKLDFEPLLEFLKCGLFESYKVIKTNRISDFIEPIPEEEEMINSLHRVSVPQYRSEDLVRDAFEIHITRSQLNSFEKEWENQKQVDDRLIADISTLRKANHSLSAHVKRLESSLGTLNQEHVEIANELVTSKMTVASLTDQNEGLQRQVFELKKIIEVLPREVEGRMKHEMDILANRNLELLTRNTSLEDQLANMESMLIETKMKYAEVQNETDILRRRFNDMRKALGVSL